MNYLTISNIAGRFDISDDEAERIAYTVETEAAFVTVWENTDWWTDANAAPITRPRKARIPVTVRGFEYQSVAVAARALGVSPPTVSRALRNGTIDSVGLGVHSDRPVTINGISYRSKLAAAAALGLPHSYIIGYCAVCESLGVDP